MNQLSTIIGQDSGGGGIIGILPLLLLAPLIYFMIVPQRKQRKQQAEFLAGIDVGDEVVTSGGIHGVVNALEGDEVHLQVDTDVVVRVSKSALTRAVAADSDSHDEESDADSKNEKG